MAYVYRHIRLDKNQPFYIGIGSDDEFRRASSTIGRNKFWKAISTKTEYEIEILMDGLTWEQACEKEKEFIALYGRRDKKNGTLVNLTDGGDGAKGIIVSEAKKKIASKKMKGNKNAKGSKRSENTKKAISEKMKGKKNALGNFWSDEKRKKLSDKMKVLYWERLYDLEYENAKRLGFAE